MSWNYRLVRDTYRLGDEPLESFTVREVYYAEDGQVTSWTVHPVHGPSGETVEECAHDHALMGRAFDLPVLDISSGQPVEVPR